ncbi:putative membrane protein [Pullulanibacillus pueri]|uniref:Beta-carotene 15,15'-monooxygenase n=1 Tax=Pullulanibacillus pueri TaxID=1437324 RepID=A0A8J2ZWV3_9BACL|nr:DUF819 family protein [Pullulanibacillus pueri]MBM7682393.1 putative membrane protein [Pullulanibacillus pueri]GGH81813.1 beta-carotene 15,15'-monooxygenase [Pullulanibacillus pueri]
MKPLLTSDISILAVIFSTVAFSFFVLRFAWAKWVGPALICVVIGAVLSNLHIVSSDSPVYGTFLEYAIPVSLTMMLLNVNLKEWLRLAKKPLMAMCIAVISVGVVAFIASLLFADKIPEGWKVAGMFVGTLTGGSSNLTAVGTGLNVTATTFASANAADYVIGTPVLIIFFALPALLSKSKWFKRKWPYSINETAASSEGENALFAEKTWSITDIALLFAIAFIVTGLSTILAGYFPDLYSGTMRIVFITTMSIILAQFKPIRQIKGNTDLGIFVAMFFLVIIGISISLKEFVHSAPLITVFYLVIILGALLLHIIFCRLFKIEYQYGLIAIVAGFADGSTSAMVAGTGKWNGIIGTAIILGSIGNVLGNYLGFSISYLVKAIIGG